MAWLNEDAELTTWALSRLELVAAVERRSREGRLPAPDRRAAFDKIAALAEGWDEISDVMAVRAAAFALLARHALRAADAAQLAAASLLADGDPSSIEFVCLDRRLADSAAREGFRVLTWSERDG